MPRGGRGVRVGDRRISADDRLADGVRKSDHRRWRCHPRPGRGGLRVLRRAATLESPTHVCGTEQRGPGVPSNALARPPLPQSAAARAPASAVTPARLSRCSPVARRHLDDDGQESNLHAREGRKAINLWRNGSAELALHLLKQVSLLRRVLTSPRSSRRRSRAARSRGTSAPQARAAAVLPAP